MTAATGVPWRPLVVITGAVLCVHVLALRGVPQSLQWTHMPRPLVVSVHEATAPPLDSSRVAIAARAQRPDNFALATVPTTQAHSPVMAASHPGTTVQRQATPSQAPLLAAPVIPAPATWRYTAVAHWRGMPVAGTATLAWQHDDAAYDTSLVIDAPPHARTQNSTGSLVTDGLQPLRFSDRVRSEEAAHFDRAQGRITFSSNRPDVALRAGAQDRLSVLVQLASLVAGDPGRFAPGASTTLQVAGTREADDWQFTVEGHEELVLPIGARQTVKLTRQPVGPYDSRLEVWIAPGPAYAPARLRLTAPNGDWLDLQWSGTDKR